MEPSLTARPKILLVEDDHTTSEVICLIFEREGYDIRAAYDGEQALRMIEQNSPDLITLNVMMPRLDGFEVCRKLKAAENTRHIPILFLTGQ